MNYKKIVLVILFLAIFCISGPALAMTEAERQTLIQQIQAQIAQLIQQLNQMLAQQQGTETWCHTFNIDLDQGDTGSEVAALQTALQKQGFIISALEIQNQQFGVTTGQAVKDFKQKYSFQITTAGTTKVGQITRGMLNQLYGCTVGTVCAQDVRQCPDGSYVSRVAPNCNFATCPTTICTPNWQCGNWSTCVNGQQTKICTDYNYCGVTTNKPAETRFCISTPLCTEGNWTYTLSPLICPSSGQQTKYWTSIGTCSGGVSHPAIETVSCNYQIPTCTSFTYSSWSSCSQSGIQTRTVTSSLPSGCTGGNPAISTTCTYIPTCTPNWFCSGFGDCVNGQQTQTCTDSNSCGTTIGKPAVTQSCIMPLPTVDIKANNSNGPLTIFYNTSALLTWTSTNANSCAASGNWSGSKNISGNETTSKLSSSKTYTLTCTGTGGTASDSVVINISSESSVDIKVNNSDGPITVPNNSNALLSWTSFGVNSCSLADYSCTPPYCYDNIFSPATSVDVSGSQLTETLVSRNGSQRSYIISCIRNSDSISISDKVLINVDALPLAPTVSIKANGLAGIVPIPRSRIVTLSWESSDATDCMVFYSEYSSGVNKPLIGSEYVTIPYNVQSVTYSIACTGPGGSTFSSVQVGPAISY